MNATTIQVQWYYQQQVDTADDNDNATQQTPLVFNDIDTSITTVAELKLKIAQQLQLDEREYMFVLKCGGGDDDGEEMMDSRELILYSKERRFFRDNDDDDNNNTTDSHHRQQLPPSPETLQLIVVRRSAEEQQEQQRSTPSRQRVLEVRVPDDDDDDNGMVVRVLVDNEAVDNGGKQFIGGYRNKITGAEYHHANIQTLPLAKGDRGVDKFHRETQTVLAHDTSAQTSREKGTQMAGRGVYQDGVSDIVRAANGAAYVTAEEVDAQRTHVAIELQSFVRQCFAARRIGQLRLQRQEALARAQAEAEERRRAVEEAQQREIERRMHPKTPGDFKLLLSEIEAWRLFETETVKADASLNDTQRHQRLEAILLKEIKLIQTVDRLKVTEGRSKRAQRLRAELAQMAAPIEIRASVDNNVRVQVQTPFTNHATELSTLYDGLCLEYLPMNERLDLLFNVKWVVKEYESNHNMATATRAGVNAPGKVAAREIIELVERETDLLNRGRSWASMKYARQRLSNQFLTFVRETIETFDKETTRANTRCQSSRPLHSSSAKLSTARTISSATSSVSSSSSTTTTATTSIAAAGC